jgi:poly(3-hydroxybutyrate) depolymerase
MLYAVVDLQQRALRPFSKLARGTAATLHAARERIPVPVPGLRYAEASWALAHRLTKTFVRPDFSITSVEVNGVDVPVREVVLERTPFCRLVAFERTPVARVTAAELAAQPTVLVVAPLSGHFATLLRDTVRTMLQSHNVVITDWADARDVPLSDGCFGLDDYVLQVQQSLRLLGADRVHLMAVCQPTVPCLAAVSLLAARGEPTPRSMILMGGPIDARRNPTAVNKLAMERDISWFERNLLHTVPRGYAGKGRRVYPGFLQLTAFVAMNEQKHRDAYIDYFFDRWHGNASSVDHHERFYDEYNAVLDMDAPYYLETVEKVFQQFLLARGLWFVRGEHVRPSAITETALFTVEGELDDISGPGQTQAAHDLCTSIPSERREHLLAKECGHYGIFSGRRWREQIAPRVAAFIQANGG